MSGIEENFNGNNMDKQEKKGTIRMRWKKLDKAGERKLKKNIVIFSVILIVLVGIAFYLDSRNERVLAVDKANEEITETFQINIQKISEFTLNTIEDAKFATDIYKEMNEQGSDLYLVNKDINHRLDSTYVPPNLRKPDVEFTDTWEEVHVMEDRAATALEKMFAVAKEDGINLIANSGYRSYATQVKNFSNNVIDVNGFPSVAEPGASEHQSGLVMDLMSDEMPNTRNLREDFKNTEAFKWLSTNAHKYGFILRYPEGKEDITGYIYEPWHYRYVGEKYAKYLKENDLTMEELYSKVTKFME